MTDGSPMFDALAALDALPDPVVAVDADGRVVHANPALRAIVGRRAEALHGLPLLELVEPPGDAVADYLRRCGGTFQPLPVALPLRVGDGVLRYRCDGRAVRLSDGRPGPVLLRFRPLAEATGDFSLLNRKIEELTHEIMMRRRAEETQRLLLGELNHRVKNTLASVLSIASQTRRHSADMQSFWTAFEKRLVALSTTHDLLARGQWEGAALRDIVAKELAPYDGGEPRFQLSGADVHVGARAAIALGMALHELATNAAKYGALSVPAGQVAVQWEMAEAADGPHLHLHWRESGGPPVRPPTRRGFGLFLIERGLTYELKGRVDLGFEEGGLTCSMVVPRPDRAA